MKLAILSTITYPSKLANRVHLLNMAQTFSKKGLEVFLFAKSVKLDKPTGYTVKNFERKRAFNLVYAYIKALKREKFDLIFIREPRVMIWFILLSYILDYRNRNVIYEVHDMPRDVFENWLVRLMSPYVRCVVVITESLRRDICALNHVLAEKTIVLPDGVDPDLFDIKKSQTEAREATGLSLKKKIVVYAGSLYEWKGIYVLREAAKGMPDIMFLYVGGRIEEVEEFVSGNTNIPNIHVVGYVEQGTVPIYMKAADVLVLPNTAKIPLSNKYTSPLKLFEYMMSGRPIVASATPAITEILEDGENAYLCTPDDPKSLQSAISKALSEPGESIAKKAYSDVWQYTWEMRVQKLLDFINRPEGLK